MASYQRLETEKYWYEVQLEREAEEKTNRRRKTGEKVAFYAAAIIFAIVGFVVAIQFFI
ncbi:MAG: hypothetical protein KDB27_08350 [Planctomycetales bacterium]|nr:hypothetical protein [Planctomycetales bacterium]